VDECKPLIVGVYEQLMKLEKMHSSLIDKLV